MSLFDLLPSELTERIYKISLEDHIKGIPKAAVEFHLAIAKKRYVYPVAKYRKFDRFIHALLCIFDQVVKCGKHTQTIRGMQEKLFWFDVICQILVLNATLIKKNGGERILETFKRIVNMDA